MISHATISKVKTEILHPNIASMDSDFTFDSDSGFPNEQPLFVIQPQETRVRTEKCRQGKSKHWTQALDTQQLKDTVINI